MASTQEVLYETEVNRRGEKLVVSKVENKGVVYADIRKYFTGDDGEFYPTKQGVRINCESLLDITKALTQLLEADEKMELREMLEYIVEEN